jgi:dienelactone hydrolase
MRMLSSVLALVFVTCAPAFAQSGPTGTWRVEGVGWEVFLRIEGPKLTGLVSHCTSVFREPVDIEDANITRSTINFKCTSPDHDRTLTFAGRVNGDEIVLTWEKHVRDGGFDNGAADKIFGPSAPRQFTAKRVSDGELAKTADEVRGLEFVAAVNLLSKDVKAEGFVFVPRKVSRARALIVVIRYGLGEYITDSASWRKLAESIDAALVGVRFSSISRSDSGSVNWADGGADALLSVLQRLAQESRHPELADAPFVIWGHSGGGGVASILAALNPKRTLAFVRYHSGPVSGDIKVVSRIPALFFAGGQDHTSPPQVGETLWKTGRALGAPWTFAVESEATHGDEKDVEKATDFMIPWITEVVRQRLSPDGKSLRAVTDGSAWLGNSQTGEAASAASFAGSKTDASWLPDEVSARGWQAVRGTGK